MLISRQQTVFHPDDIVKSDDRIDVGPLRNQTHPAPVAKAKVAIIRRCEFVFERGTAVERKAGRLSGCAHVLAYLALINEGTVCSLLVVARDRRDRGQVH